MDKYKCKLLRHTANTGNMTETQTESECGRIFFFVALHVALPAQSTISEGRTLYTLPCDFFLSFPLD